MRELFVWYRVRADRVAAARPAVFAMQRALCADVTGLEGRLLMRDDAASGTQTWMETYARADGGAGVDTAVEATIASRALALAGFIDGSRHAEVFDLVAPE